MTLLATMYFPNSHSTIVASSLETGRQAWQCCRIQAWLPWRRLIVVSLFEVVPFFEIVGSTSTLTIFADI